MEGLDVEKNISNIEFSNINLKTSENAILFEKTLFQLQDAPK